MGHNSPSAETAATVYAEQVALLYKQSSLAFSFSVINGFILILVQRPYFPTSVLLTWFGCLIVLTVARIVLVYHYRHYQPAVAAAPRWGQVYLVGVGLSGIIWGAVAIVLFPEESIGHQVFVAFVLAGMTAGAVSVLSAVRVAPLIFMLPALLPLAVQFFRQEGTLPVAMGVMTLLFLAGMFTAIWNIHRSILRALRLHQEKQKLLDRVQTDKAALQAVKRNLEARVKARTAALEREIAERRTYEVELERLASHDTLTQLPNRQLLLDRLHHALDQARRSGSPAAVLFIDLDRFKVINDSLGHTGGDELLQAVAHRLQTCVRVTDTVARLGGDEFVIVLEGLSKDESTVTITRKVLDAMSVPFTVADQEVFVNCSIGIGQFPKDGDDAQTLLKNADTALHRVKAQGRNGFQFYTAAMNARASERLALETSLRRALEREELTLYYQPQVDLKSGGVIGLEALLRWRHPHLGLLLPATLVPLAEETGLIIAIGEWVLRSACAQAKDWQNTGQPVLPIAVNLSARQFMQADLTDRVIQILEDSGLPNGYLKLEVTESLLMQDVERAVMILQDFKSQGIQLAIDDFGIGYSSLNHLKRFPIDWLKIDRSFVRDITTDPDDAAITATVIDMAHHLKLGVIAEGVETEAQLSFLTSRSCNAIQGYFFSPPLTAQDAAALLRNPPAMPLAAAYP